MHVPVMVSEVLDLLAVRPGGTYLDGTLGMGGHARAILERMGGSGCLLGMDRDAQALAQATPALAAWQGQCRLAQENFHNMNAQMARWGVAGLDGILLDLGMSSLQVDSPGRGFSFSHDGPLDMRMDRTQSLTAAGILQSLPEQELAEQLWQMGDEPDARRIARAIVNDRGQRPWISTRQLAELVTRIKAGRRGKAHPATRVFQALRIMVNSELENLERGLEDGLTLLKPGGRLAILSYHSLEDRIVKRLVREHIGHWESLPAGGQIRVGRLPGARWVTSKPVTPACAEILTNPRARSAKLRVAERKG